MKDYRILSITLSAVIALSCMPLCMGNGKEQIPEEAVIITQAEADQINSLKADGKDDHTDDDCLHPHGKSGHIMLVELSHLSWPKSWIRAHDKGLDR